MKGLRLVELSKRYGSVVAVAGVDLDVVPGEFLVLLGPSGCGKSTILKLIAGLEEVSAGDIYLGDERITFAPVQRRDVAMVFQNYALYPHMRVRDNITFPLRMAKRPRVFVEARLAELARMVRLEPLLDRYPDELSGGQRQRVAVARALIRDPAAFLLDEPLSNLDAMLRGQMRDELRDLHRRLGTTSIFVTHDQVEALTLGTRVAVMRDGRILQVGPPQDVYDRPVDLFVAGFLGTPPMNVLPCSIVAGDGIRLVMGRHVIPIPEEVTRRLTAVTPTAITTCGVRAEDLRVDSGAGGVTGPVETVETLGSDVIATVRLDGLGAVRVRVAPDAGIREAEIVSLHWSWKRLHLFDATGMAVAHSIGPRSPEVGP